MSQPDVLSLPVPYYLFRLLTGSDHMHFGWFRAADEHPGDAQENMMELNMFFRPARLQRVLDIGAGLGATARWLSRRGVAVTSISPDAPMIEYARQAAAADNVPHPVEWHASPFETFQWTGSYDWVLFQESFLHFADLPATMARAHAALRPGGRLHIADQFLHVERPRDHVKFQYLPRTLEIARQLGFVLYSQCDVSRAAYRMTDRCLEVLRERKDELIATHSAARPEIRKDIDEMLNCGRIEYEAFEQGYISYQLLTFDKP